MCCHLLNGHNLKCVNDALEIVFCISDLLSVMGQLIDLQDDREEQEETDKKQEKQVDDQEAPSPCSCYLCPRPSLLQCSSCSLPSCCLEHLSKHRPSSSCLPWEVSRRPEVGRVLLASRDILPYELVLQDLPLVLLPGSGSCVVCGEERVGRCLCGELVCGEEGGQHQHHREVVCSKLRREARPELEHLGLGECLAFWGILGLEDQEDSLLQGLMDHREEREQGAAFKERQEELAGFLEWVGERGGDDQPVGAARLLGLLDTNSLGVAGGGRALFPVLSLLSHSCLPR